MWIVVTSDGGEWIQSGGIILGVENNQGSYRSELGCLLGISSVLHGVNLPIQINRNLLHTTVLCNRLSALDILGKDMILVKI